MSPRMSAEERRESVIAVALHEFARGGYEGTSTETIAREVGVSQPYLFRLFPNKRAMFLAACGRCLDRTRDAFVRAADGQPVEDIPRVLGDHYLDMVADGDLIMMQMQMNVAAFQASRSGDQEFGQIIRRGWTELFDTIRDLLGGDLDAATDFMAKGMLINTMVALDYPRDDPMWFCVEPEDDA